MARARTPVAKAKAAGADVKNPGRHKGRTAKATGELGPPAKWMADKFARQAYELFRGELPWLKESHRVLVEMAAGFRGRMLDPADALPFHAAQELRRCLAQLGATPADESRVNTGNGDEDDEDEARFDAAAASSRAGPAASKPKAH